MKLLEDDKIRNWKQKTSSYLYESGITSLQNLCEITNILKTTVYDIWKYVVTRSPRYCFQDLVWIWWRDKWKITGHFFFILVPQKVPLMTANHRPKRETCCIFDLNNFVNVIYTDESRFQFFRYTWKGWAKFGHCEKMVPKFSTVVPGGLEEASWLILWQNINYMFLHQNNVWPHTATYIRDCYTQNHVILME